jgi:hypothetical protein
MTADARIERAGALVGCSIVTVLPSSGSTQS